VTESVTISRRFNGPPDFGHGGYSCGSAAALVDADAASVSLRRPVPLDTPLAVRRGEGSTVMLLDGDEVIAEAAAAELELEIPEPVPVEAARVARGGNPWLARHPFPTCFGCGSERDRAEAIATLLGPVAGRVGVMADTWTPQSEFADADGVVTPLFVWAALDCPTGAAAVDPDSGAQVLARLTARPGPAPARAGQEHVVMAWLLGREGRKSRGAAAIISPEGEICGISEGLWIELRDPATHGAKAEARPPRLA
jgi:hypothetical protein